MKKKVKILKKLTALVLAFTMLPLNNIVDAYEVIAGDMSIKASVDDDSENRVNTYNEQNSSEIVQNSESSNHEDSTTSDVKEDLVIEAGYTLNENMTVGNLTLKSGTLNLNGYRLTVNGDYEQLGGVLNFNSGILECSGNFNISGNSCIQMKNANDYLIVEKDIVLDNAYWSESEYKNGVIEVRGNFTATRNETFVATGYHKVIFSGTDRQNIAVTNKNRFNEIELRNYSEEGVNAEYILICNTFTRNECKYTYKGINGSYGIKLSEDTVIDGDYYLLEGEINLNGFTLTINGDLVQAGGIVNINGGSLAVSGDYRLQAKNENGNYEISRAILKMTDENDYVCINGNFYCNTILNTTGYLTAGKLEIKGDFTVEDTESNYSFSASGSHSVILSGETGQRVRFIKTTSDKRKDEYSRLANLEIKNSSETGVCFTGTPYISASINDNRNKTKGYIAIGNSTKFTDGYFGGSACVIWKTALNDEITIGGDFYNSDILYISNKMTIKGNCSSTSYYGYIVLNKGQLIVEGNYTAIDKYGISMTNAEDYVLVYKDVNFSPYYAYLSAGTFEIKGNLTSTRGIAASGNHKFLFSGDSRQVIDIAENEKLAILEINNSSEEGVVSKNIFLKDVIIRKNGIFSYEGITGEFGFTLEEDMKYEGDFYLLDDTLNLNGHTLTITGDLIQSAGTIFVNGGTLNVSGDYHIEKRSGEEDNYTYGKSNGVLEMTNAKDYVCIRGSFITSTSANQTGHLTEGIMEVKGDFIVNDTYSSYSFVASNNHRLVLSGDEAQTVKITGSGVYQTRLANYEIKNKSQAGVTHIYSMYISEYVNDNGNRINGYISIGNNTIIENNQFMGSVFIVMPTEITGDITIRGNVSCVSDVTISGKLTVGGDFYCGSGNGSVMLNGGELIVYGNLNDTGKYGIYMRNIQDYVLVYGDVKYSPTNASLLSAGTFEIRGNLTSTQGIKATNTHRFLLSGDRKQIIDVSDNDYFAVLEIDNTSEEGVVSKSILTKDVFITNSSKFSYEGIEGEVGFVLEKDTEYDGDFVLIDGTLDLNGYTLTVKGNLIQASGIVDIDGGTLKIEGDYRIESRYGNDNGYTYGKSNGILKMINEDDYVCVKGSFITNTSQNHTDCLTNGIIAVAGDFTVKDDYSRYGFVATGNHKIILNGNSRQIVTFESSRYDLSRIANIELKDGTNIEFVGQPYIYNNITDNSIKNTGYINIGSHTVFTNGEYKGSVYIAYRITMSCDVIIGGDLYADTTSTIKSDVVVKGGAYIGYNADLYIYGSLLINKNLRFRGDNIYMQEGELIVKGNLDLNYISGMSNGISMTHEKDYIHIYGDVYYNPRYITPNMTAGTFEIGGNLTANRGIRATGTHRFLFSGDKEQIITLATGDYFAIMELKNYSLDGVYSKSAIKKDELITNGCNLFYGSKEGRIGFMLTGDMEYDGDFVLADEVLDLNGYNLIIKGDLVLAGGAIDINGGKLTVNGDFRIQNKIKSGEGCVYEASYGKLIMDNEADVMVIKGCFIMELSSEMEILHKGTIELYGDFIQKGSYGYKGNGENTIDFKGGCEQSINTTAGITLGNFENNNEEALVLNQSIAVYGKISDNSKNMTGKGRVYISNINQLKDNHISGNLTITGKNILEDDLYVDGLLTVNGELHLDEYKIYAGEIWVNGDLYVEKGYASCVGSMTLDTNGILIMNYSEGYVLVGGKFTTRSEKYESGYLTEGVIEVKGSVAVEKSNSFISQNNHKLLLSNKKTMAGKVFIQNIVFLNNGINRIKTLVLSKAVEYYQYDGNIYDIADSVVVEIEDIVPPTPVTDIVAKNISVNSITISYKGSEDEAEIAGYEIYRNGSRLAITSKNVYVDKGLNPDTVYTYKVYPFDEYKNICEVSPETVVKTEKDTESPSAPTNLHITNKTGSSITIKLNQASDNVLVAYYMIYRNDELIAENVTDTVYKDSGLSVNTVYQYYVKAVDSSGNVSEKSNIIDATVSMPTITRILPADYSTVSKDKVNLEIRFSNENNNINNNVTIEYLNEKNEWCKITDAPLKAKKYDSTTLYADYVWDTDKLSVSGENTIRYTLYDEDGNTDIKYYTYFVDREAPKAVENLSAVSDNGVIKLSYDPCVSSDCTGYRVYRKMEGEENYNYLDNVSGIYKNLVEDKTVRTGKTYYYVITAVDNSGNESEYSKSVKVTVSEDKTIPEIDNMTPKAGRVNQTITITVEARDNKKVEGVWLEYKEENKNEWIRLGEAQSENGVYTYKWNTTPLNDGVYILRAIAIDENGNESDGKYTRRYTVDNTGIEKINIAKYTVNSTSVSIFWEDVTSSDFAYFQIEKLVDGKYVKIGTEKNILGYNVAGLLPDTSYSFRVVGYDNLGNRGIPSDVLTVVTQGDTIKPTVITVNPVSSYYKNILNLSVKAKDNVAISYATFSYSLDNESYTLIDTVYLENPQATATISKKFDISSLPEGSVYIKFNVYDTSGNSNALLQNGEEIIVEYMIDKTAPEKIENLITTGNEGYIGLNWDAGSQSDIKNYRIYRAEADTGVFKVLVANCTTKNYYDTNIEYGKTYIYKVSAVDIAGNEGEASKEVYATVVDDTDAPVVKSMLPYEGDVVGKSPIVKAFVIDNAAIDKIVIEYKKADNVEPIWTQIETIFANTGNYLAVAKWDTDGLMDGKYIIRSYAVDKAGNIGQTYEVNCTLNQTGIVAPVISAQTADYKIVLNISKTDDVEFSHYVIYRKQVGETSYKIIASITDNTYEDSSVEVNNVYCYKVGIVDIYGNENISEQTYSYADDTDITAPTAVLPENLIGMTNMEMAFDGMASYDNVRITEYKWSMGNGDVIYGAKPIYTYQYPGVYTVSLTVKDEAGNEDITTTTVQILEKTGKGSAIVKITDDRGNPIPYALVYVKLSDDENLSLKADSRGYVNIITNVGSYQVAAYKDGYLPNEVNVSINQYMENEYNLSLVEDELIVGELTVRRMNLQEMIEAGVDFSEPDNYHTYQFTVKLGFMELPIPETVNFTYSMGSGIQIDSQYHFITENDNVRRKVSFNPIKYNKADLKEEYNFEPTVPIVAYMSTGGNVSWLKEMYNVELGILNAADSKYYIKDSYATLNLPKEGLSLAATTKKQELTKQMGDIYGQERKTVSWVVRGDKSGKYSLNADFSGILMPFNAMVEAKFETEEEFTVNTGSGIDIVVSPEMEAYIDDKYYVYFNIQNNSGRTLYNFVPQLGNEYMTDKGEVTEEDSQEIVVNNPKTSTQTVILNNGQRISIPVFYPGEKYSTIQIMGAPGGGDPKEVYYKLVSYTGKVIKGEDLGVSLKIHPIASHTSRRNVRYENISLSCGDPVDLASGAFTDGYNLLTLTGAGTLSVDLSYDSRIADTKGSYGYGWHDDYEMHIEEENGIIKYYTSSGNAAVFVNEKALDGIKGERVGDKFIVDEGTDYSYGEYVSLNSDMKEYKVTKNPDNTYTVITPNLYEYDFDCEGRLTALKDNAGKSITISYGINEKIITEDISGKRIKLSYNDDGFVTSVSDDNGRVATLSYNAGNLVAITNPLGETIHHGYDENHRIISEATGNEEAALTNEYDFKGRVTSQTNALGDVITFTYTDNPLPDVVLEGYDKDGEMTYGEYIEEMSLYIDNGMTVIVKDEAGVEKSAVVDENEQIVEVTNENGGKTKYTYDSNGNVICEIDSYNNVTYKDYDIKGNIIKITDTRNCVTEMTYDHMGNVTMIKGEEGRTSYFTYDNKGLMTSKTDYNGTKTTYEYDENGQLISEGIEGLGRIKYGYTNGMKTSTTDCNGNTTTYTYDGAGNLIGITDALGNTWYKEYDKLGHLIKQTDALGNVVSYTYDEKGNMTSVTDTQGTTKYVYDALGNQIEIINPDGTSTRKEYDKKQKLTKITYADGTSRQYKYDTSGNIVYEGYADGTHITYTYDLLNQRISETDASGNTIKYEYYPNGNIHKEIYPDGTYTLYTYNKSWKVISITDGRGSTGSYNYDKMGNVIRQIDAVGNITSYDYDNYGRLIKETDANGNETTYEYDSNSNCIAVTTADGVRTDITYDALNRITAATVKTSTGIEYKVSYEYDSLGRVVTYTDEEGNSKKIAYDAASNIESITDALGNTTVVYSYDEMGRKKSEKNAVGYETDYEYDEVGNLIKTVSYLNSGYVESKENSTSAAENLITKTTYTYDSLGRLTGVTDAMDGVTKRTYDKAGNVTGITDANGGTTIYTYDCMGRILKEINAIGSATTYTYNAKGLLSEIEDAKKQKTKYTYDDLGRVTSMTDEIGTTTYTYDGNGNIVTVSDEKGTISRKYDCMNRITEVTDYKGNTVKYSYDEVGNLVAITYPGGEIARYGYYKNGYIKKVIDIKGQVTSYEYDGNGSLTRTVRPNGTEEICTYNAAGYLTTQRDVKGEEVINEYVYTYDERGNLTQVTGSKTTETAEGISRLPTCEMEYDADNRMISYNGEEVVYDANGNMIYGPINGKMGKIEYDCRNRLISAGVESYEYDCENNRIATERGNIREEYVVDNVSSSLSRVLVTRIYKNVKTTGNPGGNSVYSLKETITYIYGNGLISEYKDNVCLYHHYNNIGSTTALTDAGGNVIATYTYGSYGELLSGDNAKTKYLYNGRAGVSTENNGLYYMRSRYYNPQIKRFINRDVVNGSIINSQSLNKYSYVQGNPITLTDPFGLSPINGLFSGGSFNLGGMLWAGLHTALDVAGSGVGVVSAIANAVNAVLYASVDHDYAMAAMSGLSAITLGAGNLAKLGGKLGKAAGYIAAIGQITSNVSNFALNTTMGVRLLDDMADKYIWKEQKFDAEGSFGLICAGLSIFGAYNSAKQAMQGGKMLGNMMKESVAQASKIANAIDSSVSSGVKGGSESGTSSSKGGNDSILALPAPSGTNPWLEGADIVSMPAPADCYIDMALAPGQNKPGGWGTFDSIPDVDYVRNALAVTPEFKPEVGYVQRYKIPEGVRIQVGTVGPQQYKGTIYAGGGNQVQILNFEDRAKLIPIGKKRPIY